MKSLEIIARRAGLILTISLGLSMWVPAMAQGGSFIPPTGPTVKPPTIKPPPMPTPPPPPPSFSAPAAVMTPLPTDINAVQIKFTAELSQQESAPKNYQFACRTCQGITDRQRKALIFPVRGSLYTFDAESNIKLARGRIMVATEAESISVLTGTTTTSVPAHSAVVVEIVPAGKTRIYSLAAGDAAAEVTLADMQTVTLNPGRELVTAEADLAQEELIPADGIARRPVEGSLVAKNTRVNEYSLTQMRRRNLLIACKETDFQPNNRAGQALARVQRTVESLAQNQTDFNNIENNHHAVAQGVLNTVGGSTALMLTAVVSGAQGVKLASSLVASTETSKYDFDESNTITLTAGTLLLKACQPLKVQFQDRQVEIAKDAVTLIEAQGKSLKIVDLSDRGQHAVKVNFGAYSHSLKNGQEVLLTSKAPALSEVYSVSRIGHRGLDSQEIGEHGWVTLSHVYIPHVLAHHPLLKHVRTHGSANGDKVVDQVLRTAAALHVLGNNPQSYTQGQPEDEAVSRTIVSANCKGCF
jgi:hypothetical protein